MPSDQDKFADLKEETYDLATDIRDTSSLGASIIDGERNSKKIGLFKARISRLDSAFERFNKASADARRFARHLGDEEAGTQLRELTVEIRNVYYDALAVELPADVSSNSSALNTSVAAHPSTFKLPVISIPTFNGDITAWISFKDTYISLIHNNDDLSLVQKFHYLKNSLKGLALQTISAIPITELGYPQAWETLCKKFDNKRVQAANYLAKMCNAKPIVRANFATLQEYCSTVLESGIAFQRLSIEEGEGFILMTLALKLLDHRTREKFESEHLGKTESPKFVDLVDFIHKQVHLYQSEIVTTGHTNVDTYPFKGTNKSQNRVFVTRDSQTSKNKKDSNEIKCVLCKMSHNLNKCQVFLKLTPRQRFEKLKFLKGNVTVCMNCLQDGHNRLNCPSNKRCQVCNLSHNTLLHFSTSSPEKSHLKIEKNTSKPSLSKLEGNSYTDNNFVSTNKEGESPRAVCAAVSKGVKRESYVLLGTAIGRIKDSNGHYQNVRLLIDNGAQRSFITQSCANKLGLKLDRLAESFSGFGNQPVKGTSCQTSCLLVPINTKNPKLQITVVVTPVITGPLPTASVPHVKHFFDNLDLADQTFWKSNEVDLLIGADAFGMIHKGELYTTYKNGPYALNTIFGWVVMGPTHSSENTDFANQSASVLTLCIEPSVETVLQKFWEIEEVPIKILANLDSTEEACEEHFKNTHLRDPKGRYMVRLPFKSAQPKLGESYNIALRRFYNLENKFSKTPSLKEEYDKVIKGYLTKGYMSPTTKKGLYYLPHHGVVKDSSTTTKLRVVFDASMKTSLGSLNDQLLIGPKLHLDLRQVILNFRKYPIAVSADIRQMYLQIQMHPDDKLYQHMLYRFDPTEPVKEYELNVLIFGLSSAPFIAQRTLRQLVEDEGTNYPKASQVIHNCIYMDDVLTGGYTVKEAQEVKQELTDLLLKGGFELQKWTSNCMEIQNSCQDANQNVIFMSSEDLTVKILGMQWNPKEDNLFYAIKCPLLTLTKRAVLSAIGKVFDPLGYLAPVVFRAKLFLQQLWSHKLDWDERIPDSLAVHWENLMNQLTDLKAVKISRCLFSSKPLETVLVGFADASSLGYAAVLYLKILYPNKMSCIKLLASKTRLAPVKTISIPRLELCGALLLVRLIDIFSVMLTSIHITSTYLFSDSSVVLAWLKLPPNTLKVFVANRVTEILSLSKINEWYHVNTKQNPADLASRGLSPSELVNSDLWWSGPEWLRNSISDWPIEVPSQLDVEIPERLPEKNIFVCHKSLNEEGILLLENYSTFSKLQRIVAWLLRYRDNLFKEPADRRTGNLKLCEIQNATMCCVKIVQGYYFKEEIELVNKGLSHKTKLKSLSPFLDPLGVLRVGGRLSRAPLKYDAKHPILLPSKGHLTNLIIDYFHENYLHAGPKLLLALLQRRYWIVAGKRVVSHRVHNCIKCRKQNLSTLTPYMADLPSSRFEQGRAFINVGVDYAGPFCLKESRLRRPVTSKAYLCIYVCMGTKAVHLELVSDLTTDAFIACLDRFLARRGYPSKIFSDHGTNFVGADRKLQALYAWWRDSSNQNIIEKFLTKKEIQWVYSPPRASHWSGLWEAGVKSVKSHLNRVLSDHPLTYEELSTVFTRVESILNSRPLYETSSSPDSYEVLTPGHFLVGDALVARPQYNFIDVPQNRLTRWQQLSKYVQLIWQKWKLDYLNSLQQRVKWVNKGAYINLKPNTLVLLKESELGPNKWLTARVLETYPGQDGIVRVAKVRTAAGGEFIRPVAKMALLLPQPDNQSH